MMVSMKIKVAVLSTVALLFLASSASAQTNAVAWTVGQPTVPEAGKVIGSGTYTTAPGWTASNVILFAIPNNGGVNQNVVGGGPAMGNWGPININGLPTGQYTIGTCLAPPLPV